MDSSFEFLNSSSPIQIKEDHRENISDATMIVDIVKVAEHIIRSQGYYHFNPNDVASTLGVRRALLPRQLRSSSDLAGLVAKRYTKKYFDALGEPEELGLTRRQALEHYIDVYKHSAMVDGRFCLIGALGSDFGLLPDPVKSEVLNFTARNIDWLIATLSSTSDGPGSSSTGATIQARQIFNLLEGAIMIAFALNDFASFDKVGRKICDWYNAD